MLRLPRREIKKTSQDVRKTICPIDKNQLSSFSTQTIPFDVLSSVFELCSMNDWISPMYVGAVSRWRQVILSTPSAWKFVNLKHPVSKLYIERSRHCLLHVYSAVSTILTLGLQDKVHCMTVDELPDYEDQVILPQLQHLYFAETDGVVGLLSLTISRLPLLRHLAIPNPIEMPFLCDTFPPLETFIVTVNDTHGWPELLEGCSLSLTSLAIFSLRAFTPFHLSLTSPS